MIISLRSKIIFLFAIGLFQVAFILLLVFSSEINLRYQELVLQRSESVAQQLAFKTEKLLLLGLYPQEFVGFDTLLQEFIESEEGIRSIGLVDSSDKVLFSVGRLPGNFEHNMDIRRLVYAPSGVEYRVFVSGDSKWIEQKTLDFIRSVLIYSLVTVFLTILAVIYFLRINLGRPLSALIQNVKSLDLNSDADGEWEQIYRKDEIGIVARSFKEALSKLSSSQKSLKQSNAELIALTEQLEYRVKERTQELELANQQLNSIAYVDALTGVLNRYSYYDVVDQRLTHAIRNNNTFAILMLDLDGFKKINDQYGHAAGDRVLEVIGERIRDSMRHGDAVFRIGGDEFVILVEQYDSSVPGVLESIIQKIQEIICQPVYWKEVSLPLGVSIGVATREQCRSCNANDLLARADEAMYEAKNSNRNYVIYKSCDITGELSESFPSKIQ